jgi:uncharacterized membrane protein
MDYLWLKALHVAAIATFIGGMLTNGFVLANPSGPALAAAWRWNRRLVTPAILLVWALGIALAVSGDWFKAPWLMAKLALVLLLSALHGMQSGMLRRMAADPRHVPPAILRFSAPITIAVLVPIAILAVVKPF